jgi:hypothetical protein
MIAWTIKGEAGKAFDETVRSLEAAKIESAQVAFNSLADDTFTFSISPEAIPSATIPELKQQMTLYRAGVQFFTGTVTNVRSNIDIGGGWSGLGLRPISRMEWVIQENV